MSNESGNEIKNGNVTKNSVNWSHDRLLSECFMWANGMFPQTRMLLFHPVNETKPHPEETQQHFLMRLNQNKAIGVVPGVPDLVLMMGPGYGFDVKVGNDRVSEAQLAWAAAIRARGGDFYEIRTLQQFKEVFTELMRKLL